MTKEPDTATLLDALARADRLIDWMAKYIGQMAPGKYANCLVELNEHGLLVERLRREGFLPAEQAA